MKNISYTCINEGRSKLSLRHSLGPRTSSHVNRLKKRQWPKKTRHNPWDWAQEHHSSPKGVMCALSIGLVLCARAHNKVLGSGMQPEPTRC